METSAKSSLNVREIFVAIGKQIVLDNIALMNIQYSEKATKEYPRGITGKSSWLNESKVVTVTKYLTGRRTGTSSKHKRFLAS